MFNSDYHHQAQSRGVLVAHNFTVVLGGVLSWIPTVFLSVATLHFVPWRWPIRGAKMLILRRHHQVVFSWYSAYRSY